jgi:hypothetical protein
MSDIIGEKTIFTWTDGTMSEASLKQITEGFAGKYGKQKADLLEVTVGSSTKTIELNAFRLCKNLRKAVISDKVTDVKEFAFSWCDSLKEVKLPEGINRINISAFQGCTSLEEIVIPQSVTIIDEQAFSNCTALKSVILPENMYWLSNECFFGCVSLTDIDIPASVEIIDAMSFSGCTSLAEVRIAADSKMREFGPNAFDGCTEMKLITHGSLTALERIGGHAFENCAKLTSFEICENVMIIGESAFNGCLSLSGGIDIPPALKTFGNTAFANCRSLERVHFNKNMKNTIPVGTFARCENLTAVSGTEFITEIGAFAFLGCKNLKEISIDLALASVGDWAFKGCVSLDISVPPVVYGSDAFAYVNHCSLRAADTGGRMQFYSSDTIRVSAENCLKLSAVDTLSSLRCIHRDGAVPDDIFEDLEEKLNLFTDGNDERSVTFDMMDEFDLVYGTEEFGFSASGESFRDKLYMFSQEVRLG